ncbi:AAA family ATPase [Actinoplanes sp. G11-F43]|uniref:AAA family ATPase n=1 Tax=Actinoplanes sp. G11-F43 TaxID=3424130 RepID=UPI003D353026
MRDSPEQVYALADEIRERCLRGLDSLLSPGTPVWTAAAADELVVRFVNAPDVGTDTFLGKLRDQLAGASPQAIQLMAELAVIYELTPVNVGVPAKRRMVEGVLALAGKTDPLPERVLEAFTGGVANPGTWYMTRPDVQLTFLIRCVVALTDLAEAERAAVTADPWRFRDLLSTVPLNSGYNQRAALLHLMFPDTFESIVASRDRGRILDFYADRLSARSGDDDRDMLALRGALADEPGDPIHFYRPPWDGWRTTKSTTPGWLVRGAKVHGRDLIPDWITGGYCSVAFPDVPTIPAGTSPSKISQIVVAALPDLSVPERRATTVTLDRFLNRIKAGHVVATVNGADVFAGKVTGPAEWVESPDGLSSRRHPVEWLNADRPIVRADLSAGARGKLSGQSVVTDLGLYAEEILALAEIEGNTGGGEVEEPAGPVALELPDPTKALAESLFLPREWLGEVIDLLREKGQVVLYGPPGTGKTYVAQALATFLTETAGGEQRLVQFHPSYAYEDFFEGFRPRPGDTQGSIVFDLVPGPLRRMAALAEADPTRPYILVIDELNRANLAKVFGELYFLLEYRNQSIGLQYSPGEDFALPRNLLVIGTMNTADRSIALVDQAMRRRFDFVPLFPGRSPLVAMLRDWLTANAIPATAADLLDTLNAMLGDPESAIGPSYFMSERARTDAGLQRIWRTAILPLLEERFAGSGVDVHTKYALAPLLARVKAASSPADGGPATDRT